MTSIDDPEWQKQFKEALAKTGEALQESTFRFLAGALLAAAINPDRKEAKKAVDKALEEAELSKIQLDRIRYACGLLSNRVSAIHPDNDDSRG